MKKILCFFSAFIFLGATIIACAPEKRDRINQNTLTVNIESTEPNLRTLDFLENGTTVSLKAIIRNAKGEEIRDVGVNWSIEPESFGNFSSNNTLGTTFTASATEKGLATIYADCNGVKGSVSFPLGETLPELWLFNPDYTLGNKVDVIAMTECLYDDSEWNTTGTLTVMDMAGGTVEPWKISYTMGSGLAVTPDGNGNYGGFVLKFKKHENLSSYNYLCFDLKSDIKPQEDSTVHIVIGGNSPEYLLASPYPGSDWTSYKIDISAYTRTFVKEAFNLVFTRKYSGGGVGDEVGPDPTMVVQIKDIRFTKD